MRRRRTLEILSIRSGGFIRGRALPHAVIEAVNLSRIAAHRLDLEDTVAVAVADGAGLFAGRIAGFAGDLIRLRARKPGSALSPWRTLRLPRDTRPKPPAVALSRIGFGKRGADLYALLNIGRPRPISEPGAVLLFRNVRSSASCSVTLNAQGSFGPNSLLTARPGDRLAVRLASPRSRTLGVLNVPSSGATNHKAISRVASGHSATLFDQTIVRGPLLLRRPRAEDVIQGEVTNCHLAGAATAVAHTCAHHIARLIRRTGNGSYKVSLFGYNNETQRFRRISVSVDGSLYLRPSGDLLFGTAPRTRPGATRLRPLWWPILEKAYASLNGGYGHFVVGGTAHHALSILVGRAPRHHLIRPELTDRLWRDTNSQLAMRLPVVLSTDDSALRYRNTLIMANHCYAVLDCRTSRASRVVTLRNPWGEVTPSAGRRGKDGIFTLPWEIAMAMFSIWSTVEGPAI